MKSYGNKVLLNLILIIGIATLIFNETVRAILFYKYLGRATKINILYVFALSILILYCLIKRYINYKIFTITIILDALLILTFFSVNENAGRWILLFGSLILPMNIIFIKINDDVIVNIFSRFINILNVLIIAVLIFGLIDYITSRGFQSYLIKHSDPDLYNVILWGFRQSTYRLVSFVGHPLSSARYFMLFYICNSIYNYYFKPKMYYSIVTLITLLGIFLSGSKSALIILLFLIIVNLIVVNKGDKKIKIFSSAIVIGIIIILFQSTLFEENIKFRITESSQSNNFTSGRNILLESLLEGYVKKPGLLVGGGKDYSRNISGQITTSISNFEYPLLMFVYDYGIISTILIYFLVFLYPLKILLKNKHFYMSINLASLFIYMNGYNGITTFSDTLASITLTVLIITNLSIYINKIGETDENKLEHTG